MNITHSTGRMFHTPCHTGPDVLPTARLNGPARGAEKDVFHAPHSATGRPKGDSRTAEQIISDNRIFRSLPSSIPREALFKQLGDWTASNLDPQKRADAAYNAAHVLNYIDALESKNTSRLPENYGNGEIEGEYESPLLPPFNEAWIGENTEAALLDRFSKEGYRVLGDHGAPVASDHEKITTQRPATASGRPAGDNRSAENILNANPIVGRIESTLETVPNLHDTLNNLKALTGDWSENNTNANSRADAAYNISKVANYIDSRLDALRIDEGFDDSGREELTGFNTEGVNPGTEASMLLAFSKHGYAALPE